MYIFIYFVCPVCLFSCFSKVSDISSLASVVFILKLILNKMIWLWFAWFPWLDQMAEKLFLYQQFNGQPNSKTRLQQACRLERCVAMHRLGTFIHFGDPIRFVGAEIMKTQSDNLSNISTTKKDMRFQVVNKVVKNSQK